MYSHIFICAGALLALSGVVSRSLSSHAIRQLLDNRGTLDNFNLAADYLLVHGLTLIVVAILCRLYPMAKFHRSGWTFLAGSFLFQGSVLLKSFIPITPFGFLTPVGGLFLMFGWALLAYAAMFHLSKAHT